MSYYIIFGLIVILIFLIVILSKIFTGEKILEVKADYGYYDFTVETKGYYALLITGKLFRKPPLQKFNTYLVDADGEKISTYKAYLRATSNNGSTGSVQLKYCHLEPGNYKLVVEEGSETALTFVESIMQRFSPGREDGDFGYRIRKTLPEFIFPLLLAGIMGCVMGIIKMVLGT